MSNKVFVLSGMLIISVAMNIFQILIFKYNYERIKTIYARKENRLLKKAVEQSNKIIELQNKTQIRRIK